MDEIPKIMALAAGSADTKDKVIKTVNAEEARMKGV